MSGRFNPNKNVKKAVLNICKMCEEMGLSFDEISDVPAELEREINRNVRLLKKNAKFKYLQRENQ